LGLKGLVVVVVVFCYMFGSVSKWLLDSVGTCSLLSSY
jgi:hypothetical protein